MNFAKNAAEFTLNIFVENVVCSLMSDVARQYHGKRKTKRKQNHEYDENYFRAGCRRSYRRLPVGRLARVGIDHGLGVFERRRMRCDVGSSNLSCAHVAELAATVDVVPGFAV